MFLCIFINDSCKCKSAHDCRKGHREEERGRKNNDSKFVNKIKY